MSTYIIGDVQGCYKELMHLLEHISFNPSRDRLGFAGDLVNRGPQSLDTLRFIKNLSNPMVVLGNHDLHLLALGYKASSKTPSASLNEILTATDKSELLDWLRQQPLAIYQPEQNYFLVHAGVPPQWNLSQALQLAEEMADVLRGNHYYDLLHNMYGTLPNTWHDHLQGMERNLYIINAFTRLRFCDKQGTLDLINTSASSDDPNFKAWFEWRDPECDIIFGHWAALQGKKTKKHYYALDTGCVWGEQLTALRIEDRRLFSVPGMKLK